MDKKTIQNIARLSRIKLTEKEAEKMTAELSGILDYIEQLNRVNTDSVDPLFQTTGLVNSTRTDESRAEFNMDEELNAKLIGQAPEKEKGFIKVKSILSK